MVRRGRSASPPPATRRSAPTPAPKPSMPAYTAATAGRSAVPPVKVAASSPASSTPMTTQQPSAMAGATQSQKAPSMFQQMAATAGGVAVGSAVGHTIGHGITSLFGGSGQKEVVQEASAPAAAATVPQSGRNHLDEQQGLCSWEMKQFLQCTQEQADLTLCQGFNEALRQCKMKHNLQ